MLRKKRNKLYHVLIIISLSLTISLAGVSYSSWNKKINVSAVLSMGQMNTKFDGYSSITGYTNSNEEKINIDFSDNSTVMNISGQVKNDSQIKIYYHIVNNGTMLVKSNNTIQTIGGLSLADTNVNIIDKGKFGIRTLALTGSKIGNYIDVPCEYLYYVPYYTKTNNPSWKSELKINIKDLKVIE